MHQGCLFPAIRACERWYSYNSKKFRRSFFGRLLQKRLLDVGMNQRRRFYRSGDCRAHDKGCMARNYPIQCCFQCRSSRSTVLRIFRRPEFDPLLPLGWCKKRFGSRIEIQVWAEVYDKQSVVASCRVIAKKSHHERFMIKHGTIDSTLPLVPKHAFTSSQLEQILVKPVNMRVSLAIRKIELGLIKRFFVARVWKNRLYFRSSQASKLRQRFGTAFLHQSPELAFEVREVKKGSIGSKLLALKQHLSLIHI